MKRESPTSIGGRSSIDDRAGLSAAYEILYETKERIKNGKV